MVSVFVDLDKNNTSNKFLDSIMKVKANSTNSSLPTANMTLNLNDLVSLEDSNLQSYFAYQGSLTTPGCYEYVNWYVLENPILASQEQIDFFTALYSDKNNTKFLGEGNYRSTQNITRTTSITLFKVDKSTHGSRN